MMFRELSPLEEESGKAIVNAVFNVHRALGPGLREKAYEVCVAHDLKKAGYDVKRQIDIPICYDGIQFDEGLRLDLLVNGLVIAELKAIDLVNPVWEAQVISHLKLTNLKLGCLINFNVALIRDGIKRFRN